MGIVLEPAFQREALTAISILKVVWQNHDPCQKE
jgi:hypothetical protein